MELGSIIPYGSLYIDARFTDLCKALARCFTLRYNEELAKQFTNLLGVLFNSPPNWNHVLPCICVRSGLDLFFRTQNFPPGSEVIMSAINIPDMKKIVMDHRLSVVPADINLDTLAVEASTLEKLITPRTVAIVIAHVYGKWCHVEPLIRIAKRHGLFFIEDCAEAFCGFDHLGHPEADLSLFSFGIIKTCTAFSGGIVKVRDEKLFLQMQALQSTYPMLSNVEYAQRILKYMFCFVCVNFTCISKPSLVISRWLDLEHQQFVVQSLRGYPDQLLQRIRKRPNNAQLATMVNQLKKFCLQEYKKGQEKMRYIQERLPQDMKPVGLGSIVKNFWLFPVIVEDPAQTTKLLRKYGIDAYRGSTQLDVLFPAGANKDEVFISEFSNEDNSFHSINTSTDNAHVPSDDQFLPLSHVIPWQAKYLIDHVIYLPVHKLVPYKDLDKMCITFHVVMVEQRFKKILGSKQKLICKL